MAAGERTRDFTSGQEKQKHNFVFLRKLLPLSISGPAPAVRMVVCHTVVESSAGAPFCCRVGSGACGCGSDRQVVQNVEMSPVVAANVDNVAVIGENRPRAMNTIETIRSRLASDGLRCKGTRARSATLPWPHLRSSTTGSYQSQPREVLQTPLKPVGCRSTPVFMRCRIAPGGCSFQLGGHASSSSTLNLLGWLLFQWSDRRAKYGEVGTPSKQSFAWPLPSWLLRSTTLVALSTEPQPTWWVWGHISPFRTTLGGLRRCSAWREVEVISGACSWRT